MAEELTPVTRAEGFLNGDDIEPVTRWEKILAGQDIEPVTRMEYFLAKAAAGGGGGTPTPAYEKTVTVTADDNDAHTVDTFSLTVPSVPGVILVTATGQGVAVRKFASLVFVKDTTGATNNVGQGRVITTSGSSTSAGVYASAGTASTSDNVTTVSITISSKRSSNFYSLADTYDLRAYVLT